jgi:uncharacterized membrane protein
VKSESQTHTARGERQAERTQIRLDQPRSTQRQLNLRGYVDAEKFGQISEDIARFFGTSRYLLIQSAFVVVWIALNILVWSRSIRWDPYPFILLNLAFSTQAAYAAPLILLAQNRQADRDKVQIEQDRQREELSVATTDFLVREVAALRLAVGELATRDVVRTEVQALLRELGEAKGLASGPLPARKEDPRE